MDTVYLIFGDTGEYDDYCEWIAGAYTHKEDAQAQAAILNSVASSYKGNGAMWRDTRETCRLALVDHGDKKASVDYTGTSYVVVEQEVQ